MRLLLVVLALAACEKSTPEDTPRPPDPVPAPKVPVDPSPLVDASGPPRPPATSCEVIVAQVTPAGLWVGSPPDVRCFGVLVEGKQDFAWFERELQRVREELRPKCSVSVLELAATDVKYQDIVATMDSAIKVGLQDVGVTDPSGLSMAFPDARPAASSECTGVIAVKPRPIPPTAGTDVPVHKPGLAGAPVIVIARDAIFVNTKQIDSKQIVTIDEVRQGSGTIVPLAKALGTASDGVVILQADGSTDAHVINRVVLTARSAGYENLLFSVKRQ